MFKNDPVMRALAEGNVKWGDLMLDLEEGKAPRSGTRKVSSSHRRRTSSAKALSPHPSKDALEGFKTPDLRLRKAIYENFPVVVNDLGESIYEIVWHDKHVEEWRKERALSWAEFQEYELFCELRLLHALRKHADRYEILRPTRASQIVRFRMLKEEEAFRGPRLVRLNDIKTHFPVVWSKVDGRRGETTYGIQLRGDFTRKMPAAQVAAVRKDLLDALRASRSWTVMAGADGEVCRIEMNHV